MMTISVRLILALFYFARSSAWVPVVGPKSCDDHHLDLSLAMPRRELLFQGLVPPFLLLSSSSSYPALAAADERCFAEDPRCGPDGKLRDTVVQPIPRVTNRITHVVQLIVDIGERREVAGFIRFGLYGDDCPESVRQMLRFLTTRGISTLDLSNEDIDTPAAPVSLLEGGVVPSICSEKAVFFGVPSQAKAYAMSNGLRTAGDNFRPQTKPPSAAIEQEPSARPHSVAGLVSIPAKGIGHGSGENEADDRAFTNAFLVTADEIPEFDKGSSQRRRVIGQVIDNESMVFLSRLASLPIQKGVKGIIPGERVGPPLLRVTIQDVGVKKVQQEESSSSSSNQKKRKS